MELPRRERGDELLPSGEMTKLRLRLQKLAPFHDLVSVIAWPSITARECCRSYTPTRGWPQPVFDRLARRWRMLALKRPASCSSSGTAIFDRRPCGWMAGFPISSWFPRWACIGPGDGDDPRLAHRIEAQIDR